MTEPNIIVPEWVPQVRKSSRILVVGATGGIGRAVVDILLKSEDCVIGAHGRNCEKIDNASGVIPLEKNLRSDNDCKELIQSFVDAAGGLDGLVVLNGGISSTSHWDSVPSEKWEADINSNLNLPFYLSRASIAEMKRQGNGGHLVLNGTESALHGGSPTSMAYAVAKRATECLVQGLAREGAADRICVNGVRMGFIASGFHQRWQGKTDAEIDDRIAMVPLGRSGDPSEVAALIVYLLSDWSTFITGQMLAITGGDWL